VSPEFNALLNPLLYVFHSACRIMRLWRFPHARQKKNACPDFYSGFKTTSVEVSLPRVPVSPKVSL